MVMTDDESVKASATELSRHKTSLDAAQAMVNHSDLAQEDALGLNKNGNISFVRLTSMQCVCCFRLLYWSTCLLRSVFRVHSEHDKADEVNDGSCLTPGIMVALKVQS
jgi:hypothetical protein